jgi:hypothetical protein
LKQGWYRAGTELEQGWNKVGTELEQKTFPPLDSRSCIFILNLYIFYFYFFFFQTSNPVYQFLSGVRVTPKTQFLDPTNETEAKLLHQIYHYMHFAYGVYGWPMYLRNNCTCCNTAICKLCASLK